MLSALIAALLLAGLYFVLTLTSRRKHPPLPPGPPRKPIIGNLNDLPRPGQQDWKHWFQHKARYGPISSLSVLGQTIIILNEARFAVDLLEKRSGINSSRPQQNFAQMSGWDNVLGSVQNNERLRESRRNLHREIGSNKMVARFNEVQTAEVGRFLLRVLESPGELVKHIRKLGYAINFRMPDANADRETGAIILKIGYGYTVAPHTHDPLVDLADRAMEDFSVAMLPATYLVDYIPLLMYLPPWFPGAGFIRTARQYKKTVTAFSDLPYAFVQNQMRTGRSQSSFLSNLLAKQTTTLIRGSEAETTVKWSAASLYAGGADTTVSSIVAFFLAMALFPDVQRKAQAELDAVVGPARLPTLDDRDHLPYVNALVKEVFRWHPVVPMNLSHVSVQEQEYEGYWIPRGASILANIWAFTHDPTIYPEPEVVRPERFLGPQPQRDPHFLVFGFGRRVCPGRTLADANVFLTVAQALTVFNILPPAPEDKRQWKPAFLPGVISHPVPGKLRIEARSPQHEGLIRAVERVFPWEGSHARELEGLED
ncbi:cytochrome P450 [Aspergillus saccharolyticus JOP 1030-1]|uniref:Cytochrome P450 n=1 Tax=Aspergillus saccharolyticus JOP 1030-1 TaxID=1450539 RepID=A0A318Z926_9EURO|nr:cytochrome P450 [Aspergillus saccharolyticus JOP 1030-1]PYH43881.1 cytochrome P450 [Aspergillus saccharolyticus JOP 1030-1]